jgi:ATP-dependent DNA ligase
MALHRPGPFPEFIFVAAACSGETLARRRDLLAELCAVVPLPAVVFSAAVAGQGKELFAQAVALGHEGVVAKQLSSTYRPGRRSPAWRNNG